MKLSKFRTLDAFDTPDPAVFSWASRTAIGLQTEHTGLILAHALLTLAPGYRRCAWPHASTTAPPTSTLTPRPASASATATASCAVRYPRMRLRFLRVGLQCIVRLLQQRTAGWLPLLRRKQGLYAHGYATATDPNKARLRSHLAWMKLGAARSMIWPCESSHRGAEVCHHCATLRSTHTQASF